jgi:hypothetical protein
MKKTALYYTCGTHPLDIEQACRVQLDRARGLYELGTVSREPIRFGDWNSVVDAPRSALTMHKQILAGLERAKGDVVFLCESDVLYHASHFEFEPPHGAYFYYNTNVWRMRYEDGFSVWTDDLQQVSGCCASRDLGFDRHYEPGPKTGPYHTQNWQASVCNVDIRHSKTLTRSRWSPDEFRNKRYARGWAETRDIPGWGPTRDLLERIANGSI